MDEARASGPALRRAAAVIALTIVLDQLSKWAILALVMQPPRVIHVTDFFNLVLTFNTGVSFGLLGGGGGAWKAWLLIAFALAVVVALLIWLWRRPDRWLALAVGLISGGALGNIIDRLHLPGVVDFLDFHLGGWHWPAFNLADSGITVGAVLLVLDGLFRGGDEGKNSPQR